MRVTSKGRYGLKAMMELAQHHGREGLLKTRQIADKQDIPLKYLEQIINTLKRNKLVTSVRGAEGGYRLARPPAEITIFEILRALEGDLSIVDKNDGAWDREQGKFWRDLDEQIRKLLEVPLSDFMAKVGQTQGGLMYYI